MESRNSQLRSQCLAANAGNPQASASCAHVTVWTESGVQSPAIAAVIAGCCAAFLMALYLLLYVRPRLGTLMQNADLAALGDYFHRQQNEAAGWRENLGLPTIQEAADADDVLVISGHKPGVWWRVGAFHRRGVASCIPRPLLPLGIPFSG